LPGSASGGLTIALDALAHTYLARVRNLSEPSTPHRVLVIGAGTLDSLPDNGAVVTLLAVCGSNHRERDHDIVMVGIVGTPYRARRGHPVQLGTRIILSRSSSL
jgi:H+/gluconate symporter-like permease